MSVKAAKRPDLLASLGGVLIISWALAVSANGLPTAELYSECCARCHGAGGRGDGPYADQLSNSPQNFTDCKKMATISDAILFKVIKKGGTSVGLPDSMPSWEAALDDDQIEELIGYVRQFCKNSIKMENQRLTDTPDAALSP